MCGGIIDLPVDKRWKALRALHNPEAIGKEITCFLNELHVIRGDTYHMGIWHMPFY